MMTKDKGQKGRCYRRCLCQKRISLPCGTVVYRLWAWGATYSVECAVKQERVLVPLGQGIGTAARVFEMLVRGAVTPCTAADVVQDLLGGGL